MQRGITTAAISASVRTPVHAYVRRSASNFDVVRMKALNKHGLDLNGKWKNNYLPVCACVFGGVLVSCV